jgi:hypothetical protein
MFSSCREVGGIMPVRANGSSAKFITKRCHIHGRFGGKVYRRKRNGELWVYDYVYKPRYDPTVLSRRFDCIIKQASKFTNPMWAGYKLLIRKFFYYTPYFVYAEDYAFTCEDFLKIRRARDYTIEINDIKLNMYLTKRSPFCLKCEPGKSYEIKCYIDDRFYSSRKVVVIDPEADLEQVYANWYDEHLREVIEAPDPKFRCIKLYHRGIQPPTWISSFWGKTEVAIIYRSHKLDRLMYSRQPYEHVHNASTDHFYLSQKQVNECWNSADVDFKEVLKKYCWRWFDGNYKRTEKIVKVHNLWSKLVFRAGGVLGFDLEELAPDNWLPGVETVGDLLEVCGMGEYRLSGEELKVGIFRES